MDNNNPILVKNENWEPFSLNKNQSYFEKFIDVVKKMDNNVSTDLWVKWKSQNSQIVLETPNYYFKIYNEDFSCGEFFCLIREKLGEIYREDYGILWNVKTFLYDNQCYQIEQREKLQVCNKDIMSFDDLMLNYKNNILDKLEKKLLLPQITRQLQSSIPHLDSVKLIRECINKYEDYGITKSDKIVLLDDSDWFLALVDNEGRWIKSEFNVYDVLTPLKYRLFAPSNYHEVIDNQNIDDINEPVFKWILTQKKEDEIESFQSLKDENETIIEDNIKLLYTGKKNDKPLYVDYSTDNLDLLIPHIIKKEEV